MEKRAKSDISSLLYEPAPMTATDWLVDLVIALGVFGFSIIQLALSANIFVPDPFTRMILGIYSVGPTPLDIVATMLMSIPLIARRRFPWPCFVIVLILWVVFDAGFGLSALSMISVLVALFTLAYEKGDVQTIVAGSISLVTIVLTQFFLGSNGLSSLLSFQNSFMVVAVAFAGNALFARQGRMAAMEAQAKELQHANEAEASKRVEEERVRIARELHDITAHSLSAIGIQASVAERLIGQDDAAAKDAIKQVRSISKGALSDMRAIVGVLRGTTVVETSPVMGTSSMQELVDYLRGFDIDCEVEMSEYDKEDIPSHVDVALFKIAREAATNIARHSNASHAKIRVDVVDDSSTYANGDPQASGIQQARLIVSDDGSGITGEQLLTGGHGLSGMRERAQVLGGSMKVVNNANEFEMQGLDIACLGDKGTTIEVRIPFQRQ